MATGITSAEMAAALLGFNSGTAVLDTDLIPYIKTDSGNVAQKVTATVFRAYLTAKILPSVDASGNWSIGGTVITDSGGKTISAKGETPHLASDTIGIYYYLDSETTRGTVNKHYMVYRSEFVISLSSLTDEQYNTLVERIASDFNTKLETELTQKVADATDPAITACNKATSDANTEEAKRASAESGRAAAEAVRQSNEANRDIKYAAAENVRNTQFSAAENARNTQVQTAVSTSEAATLKANEAARAVQSAAASISGVNPVAQKPAKILADIPDVMPAGAVLQLDVAVVPSTANPSRIYQTSGSNISVLPDGSVSALAEGTSVLYIIPTITTGAYVQHSITVRAIEALTDESGTAFTLENDDNTNIEV